MESDPSLLSIFLGWVPMLLLIGVWIFFMKKGGCGSGYNDYLDKHLEATKENNSYLKAQNEQLTRIANALEKNRTEKIK